MIKQAYASPAELPDMPWPQWLDTSRRVLGMSWAELATQFGHTPQALYAYRHGRRPRSENQADLARALHVSVNELRRRAGLHPLPQDEPAPAPTPGVRFDQLIAELPEDAVAAVLRIAGVAAAQIRSLMIAHPSESS